MEIPEYLMLFSNDGDFTINVKFKDHDGSIRTLAMKTCEIVNLINPSSGEFYTEMRFDEWLFEVYNYQIDPLKKQLTIMVRKK